MAAAMLPDGWRSAKVGAVCAIKNNLRLPLSAEERARMSGPYPYFGPTGVLDHIDHFRIDGEFALIGEDGDHFLKFRDRKMTLFFRGKANVNNHAHIVGDSADCLARWFHYWFMHRDLTAVLSRQGVGRYKLTKAGLEELDIWLPSIQEQAYIAQLLGTWDEAISSTERLLANSRRQKRNLTALLFLTSRRDGGSSLQWSTACFDSLFERVVRKNTSGNSNVLTISGQQGLVAQGDYFNKSVASANLSGYTLLRKGEFAYNKSYSAGYPMGAIKPLEKYEAGVVSSLYICFRFREGVEADPDFFRHYFEAGLLDEEISGIAQEGARNHGLLNVGIRDFFKLRLHFPNVRVQRRIAQVINAAEQEEHLLTSHANKLKLEKRALMQQLLTGKRRLRVPASEAA